MFFFFYIDDETNGDVEAKKYEGWHIWLVFGVNLHLIVIKLDSKNLADQWAEINQNCLNSWVQYWRTVHMPQFMSKIGEEFKSLERKVVNVIKLKSFTHVSIFVGYLWYYSWNLSTWNMVQEKFEVLSSAKIWRQLLIQLVLL